MFPGHLSNWTLGNYGRERWSVSFTGALVTFQGTQEVFMRTRVSESSGQYVSALSWSRPQTRDLTPFWATHGEGIFEGCRYLFHFKGKGVKPKGPRI